ncbi:THO complex subunit 5 homolog B [Coccinella septempunctata]|uniref:THO complex subunit 5 homolog B n=1 Tax=Coccinella septempunctata TaxID=41139 RepID=UPI001D062FFC|nr:THO complex subunit 5 homolog B [Coccinella septempunctata]
MVKESSRDSSKKKRKTASSADSENEADIYKKAVDFEEKEALSRPADDDAELYMEISQDIRQLLIEIFHLKTQKVPDAKEQITKKCREACVKVAILKKLNRMEKVRLVKAREMLSSEKQKVDSINLQYQNLLYEANHLISEFNKCFQFKSKDEDIELISIDEFLREAPESVTKAFKNVDESDDVKKHELRLARLEYELEQRKNLAKLCKTLEEEKKKIGLDIIEHKKKLDGLAPKLNAVLEVTKPLQEYLNIPLDKLRAEHKLAYLLPEPLYLFYVNVDGFREVYDQSITLSIVGDHEEASQWKVQQASSRLQDEEDTEPEIEQDLEEIVEVKKRRHRKSTTKPQDPKEEKKKKVLQTHPLSVEATVNIKESLSIKLKLNYYYNLKIVTVKSDVSLPSNITGNTAKEVLMGETLLGELVEGDTGLESPNSTTSHQLKKFSLGPYETLIPDIGFAYGWAQKACGLDFLSQQTSKEQSQKLSILNVEFVMKTLHSKLKSRYALALQLQLLEQNQIPSIPDNLEIPKNMIASLTKWSSKSYQQFCHSPGTAALLEEEIVKPNDIFYCATITRNNASMDCLIVIKNEFPVQPPILSLTINYNGKHHAGNSDDIRDMERSLNTIWSVTYSAAEWILAAQITLACCYLDVFLETQHSEAFPQNSIFFRSVCARNRRKPFHYRKVGSGVYTQY